MTTDVSEKGLETLIMRHTTGVDGLAVTPGVVADPPASYGGTDYFAGSAKDYDRAHALDVPQLFAFLRATQPEVFKKLGLAGVGDPDEIDWSAVQAHRWSGTGVSPSVKEGKQAEFLVENAFPWDLVSRIGVRSQQVYGQVRTALPAAGHQPSVEIKPDWHY